MGLRVIQARLSDEDLERVRLAYARSELATSGRTDIPIEQAIDWLLEGPILDAEFRKKYAIPEDEKMAITLSDGLILETDDDGG